MKPTLLLLLACNLAAAVHAQHTATWLWTVSDTGNGDGLVEPGESVLLTLSVGFDPPQPQEGGGFAGAIYDIRGDAGWAGGTIDSYDDIYCDGIDCGDVQPNNDITGIEMFQLPLAFNPDFDPSNPIDAFRIQWTPSSYDGRTVTLDNGAPVLAVYTDRLGTMIDYAGAGGLVTFRVVPATGAIPVAGVAMLVGSARRRCR